MTMHHRFLRLAALCCALASAAFVPAHAADAELNFDFTKSHPYLGFGAQVWVNNKSPAAGSALLRDLNARYVRVSLIPKILLKELRPNYSVEQFSEILKANDNNEQRQRFTAFRDQMKALKIEPVLIFWRMPEPWVDTKMKRAGSKSKSNYVKPEYIDAYVNLMVAQMLYITRLGIDPVAVELTNEPEGAWGTHYPKEDYATLALKARQVMDRNGLQKIRIAGPGVNLKPFDNYMGGLVAKNAVGALGFASAHVYSTPDKLDDLRTEGVANFFGKGKYGPVMITEFNVKGTYDEDEPPTTEGVDASSPSFGLASGADAILLLGHGASALIYWQLQDFNWQKRRHGMMTEDGQRRPVAQVMLALFSQLPRDGKVVGTRSGVDGLYATALQSEGKTYLLLANTSDHPQAFNARFSGGAQSCNSIEKVEAFVLKGTPASALKDASARNCQLQATVAPGTAATVVLK